MLSKILCQVESLAIKKKAKGNWQTRVLSLPEGDRKFPHLSAYTKNDVELQLPTATAICDYGSKSREFDKSIFSLLTSYMSRSL